MWNLDMASNMFIVIHFFAAMVVANELAVSGWTAVLNENKEKRKLWTKFWMAAILIEANLLFWKFLNIKFDLAMAVFQVPIGIKLAIVWGIIIPIGWLIFRRFIFSSPAQMDFYQAVATIKKWLPTYYRPGWRFVEAKRLMPSEKTAEVITKIRRYIEIQEKGRKKKWLIKKVNPNYYFCDFCGHQTSPSRRQGLFGSSQSCDFCGARLIFCQKRRGIFQKTIFPRPIRILTAYHYVNIIRARENLSLVYRMMNDIPAAAAELEAGLKLLLPAKIASDDNFWIMKSWMFFRLGEAYHLLNRLNEAKSLYAASMTIDIFLGRQESFEKTRRLYALLF